MNEKKVEIRAVLKFLFSKKYDNKTVLSEIQSVYGDDGVSLRTVQRQRQNYDNGTFSIFDKNRSGRPPITQYDGQISELLKENPYIKTKEIAQKFSIDKNTVKAIIQDHL